MLKFAKPITTRRCAVDGGQLHVGMKAGQI